MGIVHAHGLFEDPPHGVAEAGISLPKSLWDNGTGPPPPLKLARRSGLIAHPERLGNGPAIGVRRGHRDYGHLTQTP